MRERMTNPPDTGIGGDKPDARANDTVMQQGENQHGVPRMPHERDESADQQGSRSRPAAAWPGPPSQDVEAASPTPARAPNSTPPTTSCARTCRTARSSSGR
jgi:hypothetical protein